MEFIKILGKINLRADILRSIMPRLSESAQIPDFTWKVLFFLGVGLDSVDFPLKLLTGFGMGSVDTESVWEVNAPKRSEPSKLFSGTAAKGSNVSTFIWSDFGCLVSECTTGLGAAKKSTSEEFVEGKAGCEANRSTFVCIEGHQGAS